MKAMQPDDDLAAIVGDKAIPRIEVIKRVWAYIDKHSLQDPKARRMINTDEALARVFGSRKRISMFEMANLISKHFALLTPSCGPHRSSARRRALP
jgi:chromatin remodeling complex protein RSC6